MPSTGSVVVFGKERTRDLAFHVYKKTGETWQKQKIIPSLCSHKRCDDLLCIVMNGNELLAVSCLACECIRVCDVDGTTVSVAFHNGKYCPTLMCNGVPGFMYFLHVPILKSKLKLLLLNCVQSMFVVGKSRPVDLKTCYSMAYIPAPHRLIAMTDALSGKCMVGKKYPSYIFLTIV